jgi:hypothetical protein
MPGAFLFVKHADLGIFILKLDLIVKREDAEKSGGCSKRSDVKSFMLTF